MNDFTKFYIDGAFVAPVVPRTIDVINPSTETAIAKVSMGSGADVDLAVAAAKRAFADYSTSTREIRLAYLEKIRDIFERRAEDLAQAVSTEMGSPIARARDSQVAGAFEQIKAHIEVLRTFEFEMPRGKNLVLREPIGVAGLITAWNWPLNLIVCKVMPALAASCTVVLKPSEVAPLSGLIFAGILHEAGLPKGVFNLVNGDGPNVGAALSAHPDIDVISFTGSTRAGIEIARAAAQTVKRVAQELGGKSANILLDDADFEPAVREGALWCFGNTGQTCDSPTRMLVPMARMEEAMEIAASVANTIAVGTSANEETEIGPLANAAQFKRVQAMIEVGIKEGATLAAGGLGKPEGLETGFFVKPTVFGKVKPGMTIERDEIFGPVISIIGYEDEEDAIRIANDSPFGLAAYVQGRDSEAVLRVARQLRAGSVYVNYSDFDLFVPFGGYKQSGNGREYGEYGMQEYLELKSIVGIGP